MNISRKKIIVEELCYNGSFKESVKKQFYYSNLFNTMTSKDFHKYSQYLFNGNINKSFGDILSINQVKPILIELYNFSINEIQKNKDASISFIYRTIDIMEDIALDINSGHIQSRRFELYIYIQDRTVSVHDFIDGSYKLNIYYIKENIIKLLFHFINKSKNSIKLERKYIDCIIDESFSGIIIHEAIGHMFEADTYAYRKKKGYNLDCFEHSYNREINIVDYANGYNNLPLPTYFDLEFIASQNVNLIKNGIFIDKLNNLSNLNESLSVPNGSAGTIYNNKNVVRMRNTIMLPGKSNIEEMISSIDYGIYLITPGIGMIFSNGIFKIEIKLGYLIKNGILTKALINTWMESNVKDFLKNVSQISSHIKITGGFCRKGNITYLGMGGPSIKTKVLIL